MARGQDEFARAAGFIPAVRQGARGGSAAHGGAKPRRSFWLCIVGLFAAWSALLAAGGDDAFVEAKKELQPRLATFARGEQPLSVILDSLHKQTGNKVVDRRRDRTDLKIDLGLEKSPFWQALDAIAQKSGCGVSAYQADGRVALVDGPPKPVATSYTGIFRVAAKRVGLTRDLDADTHVCTIALDIAWEPRFQPFYLDVGPVEVVYAPWAKEKSRSEKVPSRGQKAVAGQTAAEVEVHLAAPPRKSPAIESVEGTVRAIGPSKMLEFTFDKLKPIKSADDRRLQTQNGVKVTLAGLKAGSERWTVDVLIENPPGGPVFESFQSWLDNNRIALVRGKESWVPEADAEEQLEPVTATRARMRYYFSVKDRKTDPAAWTLHYLTPGRIVEVAVPFSLKNLPLP